MESKDGERISIAKPVASRPNCSSFRSFTELLAGAINSAPINVISETAVAAAVRPKTVRFRPTVNSIPAGLVSPQVEISQTAVCRSEDKDSMSDGKPTVLYKPLAKLVSKTTVSLLANMGNFNTTTCVNQQRPAVAEGSVQHLKIPNNNKHNLRSHSRSDLDHTTWLQKETGPTVKPLKVCSQNQEEDPKSLLPACSADRLSYDGYNWRKYGQKHVKGSEYPRNYYKCTHPNCLVKKKVERSFDGQIAEIVYKGEHSHTKPQPPKRNSSGTQAVETSKDVVKIQQSEDRVGNQNEAELSALGTYKGKSVLPYDPVAAGAIDAGRGTPENSCGPSWECEDARKLIEGELVKPRSKRRRGEIQSKEAGISGEGAQEPQMLVQNSADTEIVSDGFRWRKYGQKVVKGNPYPRSYYKCTSINCNVRKHVERASDDPKAFITTYEGKHNHELPIRNANTRASESDPQALSQGNRHPT